MYTKKLHLLSSSNGQAFMLPKIIRTGIQKDKHLKWMLVLLYLMYYVKMCSRCSILLSHSLLESAHSFSSVSISVFIGRFFL